MIHILYYIINRNNRKILENKDLSDDMGVEMGLKLEKETLILKRQALVMLLIGLFCMILGSLMIIYTYKY